MIRYKAIAPAEGKLDKKGNPLQPFNGKTCGVRFENNKAIFDDLTVGKDLGLTALQVARQLKFDFGYRVTIAHEDGSEEPFIPPVIAKTKAPASKAAAKTASVEA